MNKIRTDKQEGVSKLKEMSHKKRTKEKERLKKSLLKETKVDEGEEDEEDNMMEIEGEVKLKKKKLTPEQIAEIKKKEKIEHHKQVVVERLNRKIQKKWSRHSVVNEADRQIPSKLPKHLNTGHRGIGKTDRR